MTFLSTVSEPAQGAGPSIAHLTVRTPDGTAIAATLFQPHKNSPQNPVPYILHAHDWGEGRITGVTGRVADYLAAGYGVMTWDSRGFGQSGGLIMFHSYDHEARDVMTIVDYLVGRKLVTTVDGDPLVGMSGSGYGATVQFLVAARDGRIDAIAPENAWYDLAGALAPNDVPKNAWLARLLSESTSSCAKGDGRPLLDVRPSCLDPSVARWFPEIIALDNVSIATRLQMLDRSPRTHLPNLTAATLVLHGMGDTLSSVDDAVSLHQTLVDEQTATRLWMYPAEPRARGGYEPAVVSATIRWFDCHLKLDCLDAAPGIFYDAGDGTLRVTPAWPPEEQAEREMRISAIPALHKLPVATQLSQWVIPLETPAQPRETTGQATVDFLVDTDGMPAILHATLAIRAPSGDLQPIHNQTMALRIKGTGPDPMQATLRLASTAATIPEGHTLTMLLTTGHPDWSNSRQPGLVHLSDIRIRWSSQTIG